MSQSSPELTTRDVLQQVDRRLELIEGDQRGLNQKVEALDDKVTDTLSAQETKALLSKIIRYRPEFPAVAWENRS